MSKKFLGWDCANKTLAWSHVIIDTNIYEKINMMIEELVNCVDTHLGTGFFNSIRTGLTDDQRELFSLILEDPYFIADIKFIFDSMLYFTDNFITYLSAGVVDTLDGKKVKDTSIVERGLKLRKWIDTSIVSTSELILTDADLLPTKVIIEQQPIKIGLKTNTTSKPIESQLIFYYHEYNPELISPKLKNKITMSPDHQFLDYVQSELDKGKNKKDANYTARKLHSKESMLYLFSVFNLDRVLDNIPTGCLDDFADSIMEILAYLVENKLFY
ncbi:hypothetical protein PV-S19_0228 [Pacmanvirus S19]|nr:hypothetical protein PV-S19_0228 [Pacmanvirus S19]